MTPAERAALDAIRGYASAGRYRVSGHAWLRMDQRGATLLDVRAALMNATQCTAQSEGRWRTTGPDRVGDELVCVCVIESGVLVITVF